MRRHPAIAGAAAVLTAATLVSTNPLRAQGASGPIEEVPTAAGERPPCPCVGPHRGNVVIAGGGALSPSIYREFVTLAGGADARIVVIPTAGEDDRFPADWPGLDPFVRAGAGAVTVLHTRDRAEADTEAFVAPLQDATGVWLTGGRQWRVVDAYLGTRVQAELNGVLARDGVVGGTSAGASVLASYLVRGAPDHEVVLPGPGHEIGLGLLRDVAVDQHLIARSREEELLRIIQTYPHLLGIGLDEGTALVIDGDLARVVGNSLVGIYDQGGWNVPVPFHWLEEGDVYDLEQREMVRRADDEGGAGAGRGAGGAQGGG